MDAFDLPYSAQKAIQQRRMSGQNGQEAQDGAVAMYSNTLVLPASENGRGENVFFPDDKPARSGAGGNGSGGGGSVAQPKGGVGRNGQSEETGLLLAEDKDIEDDGVNAKSQYDVEVDRLVKQSLLGRHGHFQYDMCQAAHQILHDSRIVSLLYDGTNCDAAAARSNVAEALQRAGVGESRWRRVLLIMSAGLRDADPMSVAVVELLEGAAKKDRQEAVQLPYVDSPGSGSINIMSAAAIKPESDRKSGVVDEVKAGVCVPCALAQESAFMEAQATQDMLRFPWESGEMWDVSSVAGLPSHKVVIMGERQTGKSGLMGRLLGKAFAANEYREDTTINLGFRVFNDAEKVPCGSVEFWDVPTDEWRMVESLVWKDVSLVVLTVTLLKANTFTWVRDLYAKVQQLRDLHATDSFRQTLGRRMNKSVPVMLVVTKVDIFDEKNCRFYRELMDFVSANNLIFHKVSNRTGLGIAHVLKSIMGSIMAPDKGSLTKSSSLLDGKDAADAHGYGSDEDNDGQRIAGATKGRLATSARLEMERW